MQGYGELNSMHLDALREIGNIGSGNAATSLSALLDRPVTMSTPRVSILEMSDVVERLGGPEELLVGLLLALDGDVSGMIMFLLQKDFAHMVLGTLLGTDISALELGDEMSLSAMREVGNIMAASYLNALSALSGLHIGLSVPSLCVDMAGAILSVPTIYYADLSDRMILVEDELGSNDKRARSHILLIPEAASLQRLMGSLGLDL